ncbi:MAG TPA: ferric reductase-like transmembrane domain-containing protein [Acidobacteriaceae bacterium]|nr:ferric reductase-like transmembrane domain-containing protein [Acidobacteriaceae bacterium]
MTVLDLCSYLGLGATGAVTVNLLLGMLIALRYSPKRQWPHHHIDIFFLHRWTAYLGIVLVLTHPLTLLLVHAPHFRMIDLAWPQWSPLQPKINLAGAGALYLVAIVLVTSLLRTRLSRPLWRAIHYAVFPAAVLLFLHSILTDPLLKDGHPDLLDGGKIFVECCTLVSVAATIVRWRMRGRGFRPDARAGRGLPSGVAGD